MDRITVVHHGPMPGYNSYYSLEVGNVACSHIEPDSLVKVAQLLLDSGKNYYGEPYSRQYFKLELKSCSLPFYGYDSKLSPKFEYTDYHGSKLTVKLAMMVREHNEKVKAYYKSLRLEFIKLLAAWEKANEKYNEELQATRDMYDKETGRWTNKNYERDGLVDRWLERCAKVRDKAMRPLVAWLNEHWYDPRRYHQGDAHLENLYSHWYANYYDDHLATMHIPTHDILKDLANSETELLQTEAA